MKLIRRLLDKVRGEQDLNKLIKRGLKIGKNPIIMSGCNIDPSHCWHIEMGDDVKIGHGTQIIAHDGTTLNYLNYTRVANIKIGHRVFIGAGSIVLPGVTIGDDVIIGSGSVVSQSIPSNSIAVGSPARVVSTVDKFVEKKKGRMNDKTIFSSEFTLRNPNFSNEQKNQMIEACDKYGEIFVE